MKILAIESSCDETAAAVVEDGRNVLSNVVSTQIEKHKIFGGVVPEIASRKHIEKINQVIEEALKEAGVTLNDITAIAVTYGPGLVGALLVGVSAAKALSYALKKPLVNVHHIKGQICSNYVAHHDLKPPFVCLVASGGHSHIVNVEDYTKLEIMGRTRDDAAGEAFDKAARAMGLPYPGGVHLDRVSKEGNPKAFNLPKPRVEGCPLDMSFSGLKTAVVNILHNAEQRGEEINIPDLCASYQDVICHALVDRVMLAAKEGGYKTIVAAGGVSANSGLRALLERECKRRHLDLFVPPLELCGDNAAMIGSQAYYEALAGHFADLSLNARPTMPIDEDFE